MLRRPLTSGFFSYFSKNRKTFQVFLFRKAMERVRFIMHSIEQIFVRRTLQQGNKFFFWTSPLLVEVSKCHLLAIFWHARHTIEQPLKMKTFVLVSFSSKHIEKIVKLKNFSGRSLQHYRIVFSWSYKIKPLCNWHGILLLLLNTFNWR